MFPLRFYGHNAQKYILFLNKYFIEEIYSYPSTCTQRIILTEYLQSYGFQLFEVYVGWQNWKPEMIFTQCLPFSPTFAVYNLTVSHDFCYLLNRSTLRPSESLHLLQSLECPLEDWNRQQRPLYTKQLRKCRPLPPIPFIPCFLMKEMQMVKIEDNCSDCMRIKSEPNPTFKMEFHGNWYQKIIW